MIDKTLYCTVCSDLFSALSDSSLSHYWPSLCFGCWKEAIKLIKLKEELSIPEQYSVMHYVHLNPVKETFPNHGTSNFRALDYVVQCYREEIEKMGSG